MSTELEIAARTVAKAVEEAARQLDVSADELEYDVLSHGSRGVFGLIGIKKAKIRVRRRCEKKNEKRERKEPPDGTSGGNPDRENIQSKDGAEAPDGQTKTERVCTEVLTQIVRVLDPGVRIETKWSRGTLEMNVLGKDSGLIIGKHGQTLEAIQYIVDKIVQRLLEKRIRVRVDVEGYLANRRGNLKRLALKQAEKVWRTGKAASVGHMNAYDRRVVHMALKEDHRVKTQSIGTGMIRKLLIIPKKTASKERPSERD